MDEIVINGSAGVIGRRLVRELLTAGYQVRGLTRSARGREQLERIGARAVEADVFDEASLRRAFDRSDVVVNLLTHIPGVERMADPTAWEENDRLRVVASEATARAAQGAPGRAGWCRSRSRSCTPTAATGGSTRTRRSPVVARRHPR
ncbi:NAD dependent epimerase/dehydratase family protein [Parafrankia irregularis]|uniref:NAD dependent epimerase/dehydratase family protein n=1 Tax=Parafrankia irregularis TaxID=795642 RepID=A0A0S4QXF3_9ACTN|nr:MULTISPECIES: NAD-dependent epimerase/dehydratase family protein [Parafrankia]CUU60293.1 NAD dependent epimerase/dehydratase family protein [Parafrankia irregularis]